MPFPTVIGLTVISGLACAFAARADLRVSPKHPLLTRAFGAYLAFVLLLLVPVSAYFYVFHGDWFLLYLADTSRVPSAVALLGFLLQAALGVAAFSAGTQLVRNQRDQVVLAGVGGFLLLALIAVPVVPDRVLQVGSFREFEGGYGLKAFLDGGPLTQGAVLMTGLVLLGLGFVMLRLHRSSRTRR